MKKVIIRFLKPFIGVLLLSSTVHAQSYVEKMLSYKVTVHYTDHMVNAHVRPTETVVALSDRQYYWFSGSVINSTQGGYSGKLLNGEYEDLYDNKNLKSSGAFERGLKTGVWKSWTVDGILKDQFSYHAGQKNGPYLRYDSLGKVKEKGNYHNDLLNGKVETVSGDITVVVYYQKGKVRPHRSRMPKFIDKIFQKKRAESNTQH